MTRAGPALFVVAVGHQKQASGYTVYNFTVEDDHTYFVGTANSGVWTHNTYIVSPTGTAVDAATASRWGEGTMGSEVDSMEYHLGKHGNGRTIEQYTDDAQDFFQNNQMQAKWGQWNPKWQPSYKIKTGPGNPGGYFDANGKVLTYWD